VVEWFNNNQGFLMVILTIVYVVTTIGLLLSAKHSNKITKEAIIRVSRPFIIVDLYPEGKFLDLRVKNTGVIPAIDVSMQFDKPIKTCNNNILKEKSFPIIGPGVEIKLFLDDQSSFSKKNEEIQTITCKLSYRSPLFDIYQESIVINLSMYTEFIKIS